ncbi:MAG TPA: RNA polymerase sigma-70 factor [Actinocrinis sp.]|jgi:RNA polymerase sigma-70 factor (ECF subfamily)
MSVDITLSKEKTEPREVEPTVSDLSAATSANEESALGPFGEHRGLMFATAYRMLGSVADAEDVLQDAWINWAKADRDEVRNPKAYLVRTVTNLSLNRLTSAKAVRETYVGPWLPEPMLTSSLTSSLASSAAGDGAQEAELAESVSTAMLVVLESLSPLERAVFVLREVFGYSHAEIGGMLDRSEVSVRQVAHRAREHVQARRPRFDTDVKQRSEILERFFAACQGGDLAELLEVLAPDVTAWTDGGGVVRAARRPLYGADHVARWLLGIARKPEAEGLAARLAEINGETGLLWIYGGQVGGVMTFDLAGGRIVNLRLQANPEKLRGLGASQ